jgi:hypothetical protein
LAAARYCGAATTYSLLSIFTLIAEDLEGFVEDRSKLREDRAATNATAFVTLELRLRDAYPIQFPIDVLPT